MADMFGVAFRHLPLPKGDSEGKRLQEANIEKIFQEEGIDLVVLARYMQIFSKEFCAKHWAHTINIHHR